MYRYKGFMLEKFNERKNIFVSGGADSALLLYNLLNEQPDTETYVLTWANREKHYRNCKTSVNVVNWCINKTGNNNVVHIIKYADTQWEGSLDELAKFRDNYKICFGITSFPKEPIDFGLPNLSNNDPRTDNSINKSVWLRNNEVYAPYINLDKKDIAALYRSNNLMDLFRLTSSCEAKEDLDHHCGECWWCKERYWAFGEY
tara:strand:+ start:481 stop:1086 length:606 start_codon:yes stop_codon:yes gene_type:complete